MINDGVVFADALGNNPMVGATVACAVLVEEADLKQFRKINKISGVGYPAPDFCCFWGFCPPFVLRFLIQYKNL